MKTQQYRQPTGSIALLIPGIMISLAVGLLAAVIFNWWKEQRQFSQEQPPILEKYGIELRYPSTWQSRVNLAAIPSSEDKEKDRDVVSARNNPVILNSVEMIDFFPEDEDDISIQVEIEPLPDSMSLDEARWEIVEPKLEFYGDRTELGEYRNRDYDVEKITLKSGEPAYQFTYSRFDGEKDVKGIVVFTIRPHRGNELYLVHYQAEASKFARYLKEAETAASSLNGCIPVRHEYKY